MKRNFILCHDAFSMNEFYRKILMQEILTAFSEIAALARCHLFPPVLWRNALARWGKVKWRGRSQNQRRRASQPRERSWPKRTWLQTDPGRSGDDGNPKYPDPKKETTKKLCQELWLTCRKDFSHSLAHFIWAKTYLDFFATYMLAQVLNTLSTSLEE